jgi:hypothetical protein
MVRLTIDQRVALRRIFLRSDIGMSYLAFRRSVQPTFGCGDAVVVRWQGMWVCIEPDGYAHT